MTQAGVGARARWRPPARAGGDRQVALRAYIAVLRGTYPWRQARTYAVVGQT